MRLSIGRDTIKQVQQYGRYRWQKPPLPSKRFVVLAEGRSGSTLLVNLLNSSNQIYCDGEILNRPPVLFPHLFIDLQASHCQNKVYGFKLLDYQIEKVQNIKNPEQFLSKLDESGYKFIYLRRCNRLYHALSQINAIKKNKFHHRLDDGKLKYRPIKIDIPELLDTMDVTEATTKRYQGFLNKIPHLSLTYENNLQDSTSHQATADRVFEFIGIPSTLVTVNLLKLMPSQLSDIVENYEELVEAVKVTKYAHFL